MTLTKFNTLEKSAAQELLATTCGSGRWQSLMMERFPFASEMEMVKTAADIWYDSCSREDWMEAFAQHPKIGETKNLEEKFPATKHLASSEQAGVKTAPKDMIDLLAKANDLYEAKFGFIFIVFATGKSAAEMLRILQDRSSNHYEEEIIIAIGEQLKITIQRFKKIMDAADWGSVKPSQITTHVLDTSAGCPAMNMTIRLKHFVNNAWYTLAQGITNADGRLADLLPSGKNAVPGNYKMVFETSNYFKVNSIKGFYPVIEINFTVWDETHYHVPLLLNAFGYSTYRGS